MEANMLKRWLQIKQIAVIQGEKMQGQFFVAMSHITWFEEMHDHHYCSRQSYQYLWPKTCRLGS